MDPDPADHTIEIALSVLVEGIAAQIQGSASRSLTRRLANAGFGARELEAPAPNRVSEARTPPGNASHPSRDPVARSVGCQPANAINRQHVVRQHDNSQDSR